MRVLPPLGTGKTHMATGLAVRACPASHRVAFATAAQWVDCLAAAHHAGRLRDELVKLGRYPLIVIDGVGYIPFEAEAANLFFQLISNRYERASVIVTSNKRRPWFRDGRRRRLTVPEQDEGSLERGGARTTRSRQDRVADSGSTRRASRSAMRRSWKRTLDRAALSCSSRVRLSAVSRRSR
ncbi:ATP-binding protein [Streptomyces sp. NPDC007162]|uniref:ATP-binding protein n=1 Tax=Streptomyces sp. NPDC007162 TaxID=3156917 RepID=UPI0033EA8715